jgi:hypothetical protein
MGRALRELDCEECGARRVEPRAVARREAISVCAVHCAAPHCDLVKITADNKRRRVRSRTSGTALGGEAKEELQIARKSEWRGVRAPVDETPA